MGAGIASEKGAIEEGGMTSPGSIMKPSRPPPLVVHHFKCSECTVACQLRIFAFFPHVVRVCMCVASPPSGAGLHWRCVWSSNARLEIVVLVRLTQDSKL